MEHSKTNIFAKRLFAFASILVLVVALLPSMAFAQTPSTPDWTGQPVYEFSSTPSSAELSESGFLVGNWNGYDHIIGSSSPNTFVFAYRNSTVNQIVVVSDSASNFYFYYNSSSGVYSTHVTSVNSTYSLRYGLSGNPSSSVSLNCPIFDTLDAGLAAVRDYIDNGGSSAPDTRLSNYSLPAGNAIFIEYDSEPGDYLGIYGEMVDLSVLFPNADNFFPFATQKVAVYSGSIPSSFGEPSSAITIKFEPRGARNLLGQYNHGYYELDNTVLSGNNIVYIANPYYSAQPNTVIGESGMRVNNPIQISLDHVVDFKVFGLRSTVTINIDSNNPLQDTVEHSYTGNGTEYFGGFGEDGTAYTVDDNGNVVAPIPGAGSDQVQQSSLQQWLSGISDQIAQFFNGSINAITNLVSGASDFVGNFASLYSWLPPPVLSILQSALIIAITIGVIKVFL